jgi:hypothetical protein
MALTEQQEKDLIAAAGMIPSLKDSITALTTQVAEKDTVIKTQSEKLTALEKGQIDLTQESVKNALKSAYPDVPVETLLAIPEAARAAQGKLLQESFTKVKAASLAAETDPMNLWANAGGISPTNEAEREAARVAAESRYREHAKAGNVQGMLEERAAELIGSVKRAMGQK